MHQSTRQRRSTIIGRIKIIMAIFYGTDLDVRASQRKSYHRKRAEERRRRPTKHERAKRGRQGRKARFLTAIVLSKKRGFLGTLRFLKNKTNAHDHRYEEAVHAHLHGTLPRRTSVAIRLTPHGEQTSRNGLARKRLSDQKHLEEIETNVAKNDTRWSQRKRAVGRDKESLSPH
jgi:hypothetical protein